MPIISFRWGLLIVIALIAIPLFAHLDELPIQLWDEARLANSAFEMLHTHNWMIITFDYKPDMWSTKPPLQIWLMALSIKAFGVNEVGVRLPAVLASAATCIYLFCFFARKQKNIVLGILIVLVLITSKGFMGQHCSRTGDYDALLTFCMTVYCINFFVFIEDGRWKNLWLFSLFAALALFTKGIAGGLFFPGLIIYALCRKKLWLLLRTPRFYLSFIFALLPVAAYYLLREHYNPGYIHAVIDNEMGGRFTEVKDGLVGDFWYYYAALMGWHYSAWIFCVPCGIVLGLVSNKDEVRNAIMFSTVCAFSLLLIISKAATKTQWYEMPVYPFFAIIVGVFLWQLCQLLSQVNFSSVLTRNPLPLIFIFLVAINPYKSVWNDSLFAGTSGRPEDGMGYYLQGFLHDSRKNEDIRICYKDYNANVMFYLRALEAQHLLVKSINEEDYREGMRIAVFQPELKKYIDEHFEAQEIDQDKSVNVYKLIHRYSDLELMEKAPKAAAASTSHP